MRKLWLVIAGVALLATTTGAAYAYSSTKSKVNVSSSSTKNNDKNDDDDDDKDETVFHAVLRGKREVPAVSTRTKGVMTIKFDEDDDDAPFVLTVKKGQDVTMAHLHCATAGQNGPIVVTLLGEIPGGFDIDGRLMKSAIEDDNINTTNGATCPTPISNVDTLMAAMEKDEIYVNIHTVKRPNGEIRGQLEAVED